MIVVTVEDVGVVGGEQPRMEGWKGLGRGLVFDKTGLSTRLLFMASSRISTTDHFLALSTFHHIHNN